MTRTREARRYRHRRDAGRVRQAATALVIQSDQFGETGTVTILLVTGTLVDAPLIRPTVHPTAENGLVKPWQIQIDKAMSVKRDKFGPLIGHLDDETMLAVTRSLALLLGMA